MALREMLAAFAVTVTGLEQIDKASKKLDTVSKKFANLPKVLAPEKLEDAFGKVTDAANTLNNLGIAKEAGFLTAVLIGTVKLAQHLEDLGWQIDIMSKRFGLSAKEFQQWQYAAEQTGAKTQDLVLGVKFLQRNIADALQGGASAKQFGRLGISLKDASGQTKTAADVMGDLADAVGKAKSDAERTGIALHFLGKGGVALLPLLKSGKEGIAALAKRFAELGGGLSNEFVHAATDAKRAQMDLGVAALGLKDHIGVQLLPAVTWITTKLTDLSVVLSKVVHNTNTVRTLMLGVGTASILSGVKLGAGIATKLGLVEKLAAGASRGLLGTVSAFGQLLKAGASLGAKLLFAFLIIEDIYTLFTGGKSAIGAFIDGMFGAGESKKFVEAVKDSWNKIGPAIKAAAPWLKWFADQSALFLKDVFHGFDGYGKMFKEFFGFLGDDLSAFWTREKKEFAEFFELLGKDWDKFVKDHPILGGIANIAAPGGVALSGASQLATSGAPGGTSLIQNNDTKINLGMFTPGGLGQALGKAIRGANEDNANTFGAVVRP